MNFNLISYPSRLFTLVETLALLFSSASVFKNLNQFNFIKIINILSEELFTIFATVNLFKKIPQNNSNFIEFDKYDGYSKLI